MTEPADSESLANPGRPTGSSVVAVSSSAVALESQGWFTWTRLRVALIALYAAGYVWWFFDSGVIIDRISVLLSIAVFLVIGTVGRPAMHWLRMVGDMSVIAVMWLAYDESRGIADRLGFPIQVESVRNLDRWLFLGTDPVVWLQDRFLGEPGNVFWYDVVGSMVYYSHFIVPPVTIAVLWYLNRRQWLRFMRRLGTVLFVACAMFVVLPTAPPWMAGGGKNSVGLELDALPPLRRPTGNGWRYIGLEGFVKSWDHGRDWANQVAALPSLHSAFALLIVVFFFPWIKDWRIRGAMLLYPLTMALALMYFAEHYLVDAFAGWAIVGGAFLAWNRIEDRLDARRNATGSLDGESIGGESIDSESIDNEPSEGEPTTSPV